MFPIKTLDPFREDLISAGYLSSSVLDICKSLLAVIRDEEWSLSIREALQESTENRESGEYYEMGWGLKVIGDGTILFHEGMIPAYYAVMIIVAWNTMPLLLDEPLITQSHTFWRFYGIVYGATLLLLLLCSWILLSLRKWSYRRLTMYRGGVFSSVQFLLLPLIGALLFPFIALVLIPQDSGFPFWRAMWEWQKDLSLLGVSFAVFMVIISLLRLYRIISYLLYARQPSH